MFVALQETKQNLVTVDQQEHRGRSPFAHLTTQSVPNALKFFGRQCTQSNPGKKGVA